MLSEQTLRAWKEGKGTLWPTEVSHGTVETEEGKEKVKG